MNSDSGKNGNNGENSKANGGDILMLIQSQLKAPKGQINKFGGYKYRSCEDIVEAVKPLLAEYGATLILSDDIVEVGGRVYVKATATIADNSGRCWISHGYAREAEARKGMDESQMTGAASSYARKYALNGLLAIDDTKDADATNNHGKGQISGEPIDMARIERAANYIKAQIDSDEGDPDPVAAKLQEAYTRLNQDDRMEVDKLLGDKAPGTNRTYKTMLKDYLKMENGNG